MTRPQLAALCVLWLSRNANVRPVVTRGMLQLTRRHFRLVRSLRKEKLVVIEDDDGAMPEWLLTPRAVSMVDVLSALGMVKRLAESLGGIR